MKYGLSFAALAAALSVAGCVVPVDRYHDRAYYGHDDRRDCGDRERCDRHDHDGDRHDDHDRP